MAPWIVAIVGSIASIVAAVLIIMLLIQPRQDQIKEEKARYDAAYDDSTQAATDAANKQLKEAQEYAADINKQWHIKEAALMPPFDVKNRTTAWHQLAQELSQNLGPSLERWIDRTGVTRLTAIAIQAPPSSPNAINGNTLQIPISGGSGAMSVRGDFRSLLSHVIKWNDFNRLVLIDQLNLTGNSPYMTASYTAKVIIFPQNPTQLGGSVEKSGTATGAGAAGGFGPGGFGPGGPGGMPPGMGGPPPGYGGR